MNILDTVGLQSFAFDADFDPDFLDEDEEFDFDELVAGSPPLDIYVDALRNALIPIPNMDSPLPTTEPRPGCFYRIQYGKGGLLKTVSRAYGVTDNNEKMWLAERVNNHHYNRLFWVTGSVT